MVSLYTISIFHNCEKSIGNWGFEITKCTVGAAIGRPKGFGILSFTEKRSAYHAQRRGRPMCIG